MCWIASLRSQRRARMVGDGMCYYAPMEPQNELASYQPLTQILLKNRGITTRTEAETFLNPNYQTGIYDPFLIMNMDIAVDRIMRAIECNEWIIVYGDYDCDGIPGSVILHDFFKKIGYANFENYIPHRHNEGYGLNVPALEKFAEKNIGLVITVDCGITDVAEVARANELGIDVIITDHHLPQEILPPAYTIINSKQESDTYPDRMLCGAAVAWKLASALLVRGREQWSVQEGWEKWLLDMAGLSTIADMVPLKNENRILAYYGLKVLRKSRRLGLLKLLQKIKINQEDIVEDDIGFMIGPRINAASRMGEPMDAFRLLSTTNAEEATRLATHLASLNDTRKALVAQIVKDARKHLDHRVTEETLREVVVIGNPSWTPGIAGLVATNLSEAYMRTVFVWGRTEEGMIKGSCRSDGSVNLVDLMTSVPPGVFVDMGGHKEAGGFSTTQEMIHTLEEELVAAYQLVRQGKEASEQMIDTTLTLGEVNMTTWSIIEKFAPFGMENPKPTFLFEDVCLGDVRRFGKEDAHIELSFTNSRVKAISFFADTKVYDEFKEGDRVDLVATIELSVFRGRRELRLRVVSLSKRS